MLNLDRKSTIKTLESNVSRINYLPQDYYNIMHLFKNEKDMVDIPLSDIAISFCECMSKHDTNREIYKFDNSKSEDKLEYYCNHCIIYEQNLKDILDYIVDMVTYKIRTNNKNYTFFIIDSISNCICYPYNTDKGDGNYHDNISSIFDMTKTQYKDKMTSANIQTLLQLTNSFIIITDELINIDNPCGYGLIDDLICGRYEKYQGPMYLRYLTNYTIRFISDENGIIAYIRSKKYCYNNNNTFMIGPNEDVNDTIKEVAEFVINENNKENNNE